MGQQTAQGPQAPRRQPQTPQEWTDFIQGLEREAFLVGPVQEIREIPEGFDVTVTRVVVDVEGETYWVGKNRNDEEERGLGKSAIERLAAAAGASVKLTRTDDRSHPRRCEYTAVAVMRLLDGSPHYAEASRAYDMTEDGTDWISTFDAAAAKAYDKAIKARRTEEQASQEARDAGRSAAMAALGAMHRNAETKARLRALRTCLGLRSKYRTIDLQKKHFMVLRLSATGRSSDPQLRREFSRMLFASATGATHALFGPPAPHQQATRALAYEPVEEPRHALPGPGGNDGGADDRIDDTTGEIREPEQPATQAATAEAPATTKPDDEKTRAVDLIPKGRGLPDEGKPLAVASVAALEAYAKLATDVLAKGLDAKGQPMTEPHRQNANAKLQRILDEIEARKAVAGEPF
jgi:hypothetical protein